MNRLFSLIYSLVVFVLTVFLFIRFTPFFNDVLSLSGGGVHDEYSTPIAIIFVFLLLSLLGSYKIQYIIRNITVSNNKKILLLFVIIFVTLIFGKTTYTLYTDEVRDVDVSNFINENSISSYVTFSENDRSRESRQVSWAQSLHPPGHYVLGAFLPSGVYSAGEYRLLYLLPLIIFASCSYLVAKRFDDFAVFVIISILLFTFSFTRNYTFIRYGNEIFPFIFVSCILILLYYRYHFGVSLGIRDLTMCAFFAVLALWAKSSAVVALAALASSLVISWFIYKQAILGRAALVVGMSLVIAMTLYVLVFYDTPMLDRQLIRYKAMVMNIGASLGLEIQGNLADRSGKNLRIVMFLGKLPVTFGLPITFALALWLRSVWRRRFRVAVPETTAFLFILIGIAGVASVHPRAQYAAPLILAVSFLASRPLLSEFDAANRARLLGLFLSFSAAEIALRGTA